MTEMNQYVLRAKTGYPVVEDIEGTPEEMLAGVKAANTMHPEYAPHYATSPDGETIESDEKLPKEEIEEAIGEKL